MSTRAFASDNASGIHPKVLDAIAAANQGHTPAYGEDPWTARAKTAICDAFDADAEVLFCFGGTGANVLGLAAATRPYEAVLCAESAHVWNSECAAPERFFGGKLIPLTHSAGKLACETITQHLGPQRGVHHTPPRVITITQPTELGTLYTLDEMRVLGDFAHEHELLLHVDGARFANAAAALGVSFAELCPAQSIDILSFGGTKNGLLGGEAVIFFDAGLAREAAYARKQATQLASKMRFVAAQFLAYMENELWRELAAHANHMATRLATHCAAIDGLELVYPVECNMLFPKLPKEALDALHEAFYFYTWDERESIARWVTSFDTQPAEVDELGAFLRTAVAAARR